MLKENDQDRFVLDSMKNENTEDNLLYRQIIAVTNRRLCSRPFLQQMERVCSLSVPLTAEAHSGKNWLEAK